MSGRNPAQSAPTGEERDQEARYQKRILRFLVIFSAPFILAYGIVLLLLCSPFYVMAIYLVSIAVLVTGFILLSRPMPAERFMRIHRLVAVGYIAALLCVQVLSIVVFNRMEFASWILLYPSLIFLIMPRREGLPMVVLCGLAFFLPLLLAMPVPLTPAEILVMKVNLILIFAIVAASTFYIDQTRRRVQADLVLREREAERMRKAAEDANLAKSRFLANVSHELRTPLNHIIGFNELLREHAAERGDQTSLEYLGDILESGRHLVLLVNDILDLSRIEAGRVQITTGPVSAAELLKKAEALVIDRARGKRVSLERAAGSVDGSFRADGARLTQVLVNLLVNAVKFTPPGGRVTYGCRMVDSPGAGGTNVEFFVSDTGIGIPDEGMRDLFQPFTQLTRPGVRAEEGAGLGLALSRGLIESHGGRIWAESEGEGKGSTFRFQVPAGGLAR
jgi:signal transduction histidine kinase